MVGAGVIGAAVAYEAARRGLRVVLVDRAGTAAAGATRWSLAGLSWLSATDECLRRLCWEGLQRHRSLSDELEADTSFRPLPQLILAPAQADLDRLEAALAAGTALGFRGERIPVGELACLEPGLQAGAVVGAIRCEAGHVDPVRLTRALLQAAVRSGAYLCHGTEVQRIVVHGQRCVGVETTTGFLPAGSVLIAAGAWTRPLLHTAGVEVAVLHTHAEVLETGPRPPTLSHLIMVADGARARLEVAMAALQLRPLWEQAAPATVLHHRGADRGSHAGWGGGRASAESPSPPMAPRSRGELLPAAVEFCAVQFPSGCIRFGQVSRAMPGYWGGPRSAGASAIRQRAATFFPQLACLPATLHGRPVAITADRLPAAGRVDPIPNLYVAAGMPSPLVYAPALAARLAALVAGTPDAVAELARYAPDRLCRPAPTAAPTAANLSCGAVDTP